MTTEPSAVLTPATQKKRRDLLLAIDRLLKPFPQVMGVVGVGSIAMNTASDGSDIDALVFMQPINEHIIPAESIWCPWDDTFHSIFTSNQRAQAEGIQLDCKLCELHEWETDESVWTDGQRAGLAEGWIAFDRDGRVAQLIVAQTAYSDSLRLLRLDTAITRLDQLLSGQTPEHQWVKLGPLLAFDRLGGAYDALIDLLFAVNRRWRFWRDREMTYVLRLPWLPQDLEQRLLLAQHAPSLDHAGYLTQALALRGLFDDCVARVQADGIYADDPVSESFMRLHGNDPGRVWDIAEWSKSRAVPSQETRD